MTAPDPRLGEIEGKPAAFHKLNRSQLLTLAIALQDQRDSALAELRKAQDALGRVEGLHKPVVVYELDDLNGSWVYDGDERRVLTTLCGECTPDFVLSEIEEGDYDGGGSDADIHWPCPTAAAVAAAMGGERG